MHDSHWGQGEPSQGIEDVEKVGSNSKRGRGCLSLHRGKVKSTRTPPSSAIFYILLSTWRIFVESLVLSFVFLYEQIH